MNFQLDETMRIAGILKETNPFTLFHIASYLNVPDIYNKRNRLISRAKEMFANGELIKDKSRRRTLGGCFFAQIDYYENKLAHRVRVAYRKENSLPKLHIPKEFKQI